MTAFFIGVLGVIGLGITSASAQESPIMRSDAALSPQKALAYSILLPGLGQRYVNDCHWGGWGTSFALLDIGLWASLFGVNWRESQVDNSFRTLAASRAGADIEGTPADSLWVKGVNKAASNPNVYCKVSGLFQQSHRSPSPKRLAFYGSVLDELWTAFGEDRLIYGSNWPVSMKGGDYASYKTIVMEYFSVKGCRALEKLLYQNALEFYGLPPLETR